jgi:hypothetical protein
VATRHVLGLVNLLNHELMLLAMQMSACESASNFDPQYCLDWTPIDPLEKQRFRFLIQMFRAQLGRGQSWTPIHK